MKIADIPSDAESVDGLVDSDIEEDEVILILKKMRWICR